MGDTNRMDSLHESHFECPKCKAANPSNKKYCGDCGAPLDPVLAVVKTYLDENLKSQIEVVIKDRFKGQEITEIALAAKVAERLSGWAKLLALAVGIPLTLMSIYLGILGFDFKNSIKTSKENLSSASKQVISNQKALGDLTQQLKETEEAAEAIRQKIPVLKSKIDESTAMLGRLPAVLQNQGILDKKVKDLGIGAGVQIFTSSKNAGKALGVDVSHANGKIDWARLKVAGASFAFIKATQGTEFIDPLFLVNWQLAKKAGILRGAYHFLLGGNTIEQATFFAQTLHQEAGDLPPVVDFEANPQGPSATIPELRIFAKLVEQNTGCVPLIYSGHYIQELIGTGDSSDLGQYPLYLSQYGPTPVSPTPWATWTFWQFTYGLVINDLPAFDFNVFNGSSSQLKDFARRSCKL